MLLTGCRSQATAQFLSGDQEPWAFRGGLAGEFQVFAYALTSQIIKLFVMLVKKMNYGFCVEEKVVVAHSRRERVWSVKGGLFTRFKSL